MTILYVIDKKRFKKKPDNFDLELIEKISNEKIPFHFPTQRMPMGGETRRNDKNGLTHVHHYFTSSFCADFPCAQINKPELKHR